MAPRTRRLAALATATLALSAAASGPAAAGGREALRILGSSTVVPVVDAAGRRIARSAP